MNMNDQQRAGNEAYLEGPDRSNKGTPPWGTAWLPRGFLSRLYPLLAELWQLLDALAVAFALYACLQIYGREFEQKHILMLVVTSVLMFSVYSWSEQFYRLRTRTLAQEAGRLLRAWLTVVVLLLAIGYLTLTITLYDRAVMLDWIIAAFIAQLLVHIAIRRTLHAMRRRGYNLHRTLVLGCGAPLERHVKFVNDNPWLGIRIEGYVAEPSWLANGTVRDLPRSPVDDSGNAGDKVPYLGSLADINRRVEELSIHEIYVTLPLERSADAEAAMRTLVNLPVNINWIPDFSLARMLGTRSDQIDGRPLVLLSDSRIDRHGQFYKRVEDVILSTIILVLLAPLMLAIAWAVKRSSPGPVLFKQRRYGLGGRPIVVWKYRTMRMTSDSEVQKQATRDDDRVTSVGKILRRWSLDELPQLFNVLLGDMSLIGPRPHPIWLDNQFSRVLDSYMRRHRVKPGITGWAQVHGFRGETDTVEKMEQRVSYDLYYITHWSPWLDIKILLRTVPTVLFRKNAY